MPYARSGEAVYDGGKIIFLFAVGLGIDEISACLRGLGQFLGGPFADFFRIPVTPNVRRQDCLVPFVYEITNGLSDQVTRNGKAGKSVIGKNLPSFLAVLFGDCRLVHAK